MNGTSARIKESLLSCVLQRQETLANNQINQRGRSSKSVNPLGIQTHSKCLRIGKNLEITKASIHINSFLCVLLTLLSQVALHVCNCLCLLGLEQQLLQELLSLWLPQQHCAGPPLSNGPLLRPVHLLGDTQTQQEASAQLPVPPLLQQRTLHQRLPSGKLCMTSTAGHTSR